MNKTKIKFAKAPNGNFYCPHCGEDKTFANGKFALTTEGTQLFPYWCEACNLPFHIERRNGKIVGEDEF